MSNQINQAVSKVFNQLADALETGHIEPRIKIGLTIDGSELGLDVMRQAAETIKQNNLFDVVLIGSDVEWARDFEHVSTTDCQKDAYEMMEELLHDGKIDGCVTLHYNFPIGVATVGRVITPAFGREMIIATTTGTASTQRNEAMLLNAINGVAVAKTLGHKDPTVGILNVDGAKTVERALVSLKENGYELNFGESARADGGIVLRGNDLLTGTCDVVVCDSLTGNVLMKLFSAYNSGGQYEVAGFGYGPGVGLNYRDNICIISRASGAPVIANALTYAYELAKGKIADVSKEEYDKALSAQLNAIRESLQVKTETSEKVIAPEKEIVTAEIGGIDVMELEEAVQALWNGKEIYTLKVAWVVLVRFYL